MRTQYKSIVRKATLSLFILFAFEKAGFSQIIVGGPGCAAYNVQYTFYVGGSYNISDYFQWTISGGVAVSTNTGYVAGYGLNSMAIKFTSSGSVSVTTSSSGTASQSVTIYFALTAGSITSNSSQTINYNSAPATINCSPATNGSCTPTYYYQWQKSTDGSNWTDMSGKTSQNLSFSYPADALQQMTYFRRKVREGYSSSVGYSNNATVFVNQPLNANSVSPATQNIFAGDNASSFSGSPAYGGSCGGSYTYQWESSTNGSTYNPVPGATSLSYSPGVVNVTTYYRRRVNCGSETAYTPAVLVNVYPHLAAGSISPASGNILYNTSPGQLAGTAATPGMCGSVSYQWQSSPNNSTWTNISGATGQHYTPGNLTAHTFFRRRVICGPETLYSNTSYITVYNPLTVGVLSGGTSPIYTGESPGQLSLSPASEGNCSGNYTYQWYYSEDGVNYSLISGVNGLLYSPGNLWTTRHYRVTVTCGSQSFNSNVRTITVYPQLNPGSLTTGSFEVPFNTVPAQPINAVVASGGNCGSSYNYKWQYSTDNVNWTYIPGAQSSNYTFSAPQTTGYYYRRETECSGIKKYTNAIAVSVSRSVGAITCSQVIQPGGSVSTFALSNSGGGAPGTAITYQWESSPDEINWTTISGATNTTYTPASPASTTYYRVKVGFGAYSAYPNTVRVYVKAAVANNMPNNSTAGSNQTAIAMPAYTTGTNANNQNYIRTRSLTKPGITTLTGANGLTAMTDVMQVTDYVDGLGRHIQSVAKNATPAGHDMIATTWYDSYGREAQKYLPYTDNSATGNFRTNPNTQQPAFYNSYFSNTEGFYYSNTVFESSPLNRPLKTTAAGKSWTGSAKGVRTLYRTNRKEEDIRIWTVGTATAAVPAVTGVYAAGQLHVTEITDESESKVLEYKDKQGRVILKKVLNTDVYCESYNGWLSTYYVYDDFDRLRWVLQPRAVEWLVANSWNLSSSTTVQEQLCFRYEYDARGRMTIKKVPGAGELWMVYDNQDRLVMTQDANLRTQATPQWMVTVYDHISRPVKTGLLNNSSNRAYHETQAAAASPGTNYPSTASGFNLLTETFYDNYSYPGVKSYDNTLNANLNAGSNPYAETNTQSNLTKGLVTGTRTLILGTSTYLVSSVYYDSKGRVIQTKTDNISGGEDIVVNQYDFSGKMLSTYTRHQKPSSTTINVLTKMSYDHGGRVLAISKSVNGAADKIISQHSYDALGQLKKKELGKKPDNSFLETQDYTYNIRGWLTAMNKDYATNSGTNANNRMFGMLLSYDFGFTQNQLNGNIAGQQWRSRGDGEQRAYGYAYDNANRLLAADFNQNNGGWNTSAGLDFSVSNLTYDANGNILTQKQKGWKITGSTFIDQLTYNYKNSQLSNQLLNVIDAGNDPTTRLGDFRTSTQHPAAGGKTNATVDYEYDVNGNMVKDLNKDILTNTGSNGITYNHLNLPSLITVKASGSANKGTVTYSYDAAGNKLKKTTVENNVTVHYNGTNYTNVTITTTTTYIGFAVYESKSYSNATVNAALGYADRLQFISHEEGRARLRTSDNSFQWDYFVKDHLGNVRMVLTDEVQNDAYATLSFENDDPATTSVNELNDQNAQWENASGTSINVTGVRTAGVSGFNSATGNGSYVRMIKRSTGAVGAAKLLKVMAGDRIHVRLDYFYSTANSAANNSGANPLTSFINGLTAAFGTSSQVSSLLKNDASAVTTQLAGNLPFTTMINPLPGNSGGNEAPKAYLNVLFFNEQFRFDAASSVVVKVAYAVNSKQTIDRMFSNALTAGKSGYVYIYFSNESETNVYFDNFMLTHERGSLIEETHYYPFGLTMAGISSKTLNSSPENKYKYNKGSELQNKEFSDGSGLELYATNFRSLDPQLGRWWQIDPKPDYMESPYAGMKNNPIRFNDPLGDTVKVTGSKAALEELVKVSDNALGGFYKTKIGKDGKVSFESTGKKGKMTDEQKGYYNEVSAVLNQKETVNVGIVQKDGNVIGGSYALGKIDISDIAAFGNNKAMSAGSTLGHEIIEQSFKQKDGMNYNDAHAKALATEQGITGYTRNEAGQTSNVTRNADGTMSGTITVPYTKGGKTVNVTITLVNNNITKVEEK